MSDVCREFDKWLAETFPGSVLESDLAKAYWAGWKAAGGVT